MKTPKGFFTYFHHSEVIDHLSDVQAGKLYKALLRYGMSGHVEDFSDDPALEIVFILLLGEVDHNFERYAEICEKRSEAGRRSAELKKERKSADEYSEE